MKKMMFNNKYGLNTAVLNKTKTNTRRIAYQGDLKDPTVWYGLEGKEKGRMYLCDGVRIVAASQYAVGEIVAIAQCYGDLAEEDLKQRFKGQIFPPYKLYNDVAGWSNKMFVKAELMPHHIKITNIRCERLQDISEEDCLKEGIHMMDNPVGYACDCVSEKQAKHWWFETPREAFASLIDKVSGKGTWKSNPYVFVYEFELID